MYSILIVDDDPWMVEYLSKCIPWEEMNITGVFEAGSGEAATEILKDHKIDIVISDVKMGEKDGIQLLKEIKTMHPMIKVILLSGVDSAKNVREAFRTGAVDFLFKPVDTDALQKLVGATIESIEKEREGEAVIKLVRGCFDDISLIPRWIREDKPKIVCVVKGKSHAIREKSQIESDIQGHIAAGVLEDELVIIYELCDRDAEHFEDKISRFHVYAGFSNRFTNIQNVKTAYEEASKALDYSFYDGEKRIFHVSEGHDNRMFSILQDINLFSNILKAGKYGEAGEMLEKIFLRLKEAKVSLTAVHTIQIQLMDVFYQLIDRSNQNPDQVLCGEFCLKSHYEHLRFRDITEMRSWTSACLKHCIDSLRDEGNSSKRKIIRDIEKIIVENLDKEISLEKIALQLYLNPSYLSRLFKENVGKSYTKYVMEKRIEKAKELLQEENYKIYEIGEFVGYENTKYFNKVFKEMVGMTPKEYREKSNHV